MSNRVNELGEAKYFANFGLDRNKNPLPNLAYKVEVIQLKEDANLEQWEKNKFKDEGYLILYWTNRKADKFSGEFDWAMHGAITVDELKARIGEKQYGKFCQGKRIFIIQRRVDGKNVQRKDVKPKK